MPRRPANRDERDISTAQPEPVDSGQEAAAPARSSDPGRPVATPGSMGGVVGDASATGTRSGEDARRRGWFWHWNSIVTQYAPMIGLKGVGLVNSYTVWTDRRESSPHRGYAFPSQQREADFYGEDRAELITINKILVALDLIEIRKEMVLRTDEKGRRWKVPHNFYRVKDHGDGFSLTARDVLKVAALAERDRAVYRYLRRMFSPRFAPIDSQNVWHQILEEVRQDATWQRLAARTERDESKASARSKAGHAARRASEDTAVFSAPMSGDSEEFDATVIDSGNDSITGGTESGVGQAETSVAASNTGLATSVAPVNSGLTENAPTTVGPINSAPATSVAPTNRTYHQEITTTTTDENEPKFVESTLPDGPGPVPDDAWSEERITRLFEEANARPSTPAERRLLRQLAAATDPAAGGEGWAWLGHAIDDAVAAGSTFVAPRRLREILTRWGRDGLPAEYAPHGAAPSPVPDAPVTRPGSSSHRSERTPAATPKHAEPAPAVPVFTIEACGMTNRQVWAAVLADLQLSGAIGRAELSTWLRDAAVVGVATDGGLVIGLPHELAQRRAAGRYQAAIRQAVERVTGIAFAITFVLSREWAA